MLKFSKQEPYMQRSFATKSIVLALVAAIAINISSKAATENTGGCSSEKKINGRLKELIRMLHKMTDADSWKQLCVYVTEEQELVLKKDKIINDSPDHCRRSDQEMLKWRQSVINVDESYHKACDGVGQK